MAAIVWAEASLIDNVTPGSAPGTDSGIDNAFDASAYADVYVTVNTTGGTSPYLTVVLWLWNGTRFVQTGGEYDVEPGADNLVRIDGGGLIALEVTANGSPTTWALNIGTRR